MSEKKAMSLNERHQQLLLHRSSQSKNPPPGEKRQSQKVRMEGRRRLCKLSSRDDETLYSEPNFSGITDFDSPSPPPEKIRDILDDLSSKLDFLSIEKKTRVGGAVKPLEDQQYQHSSSGYSTTTTTATTTTPLFVNKGSEEEEGKDDNDGGPDYASASSKFSLTPDDADPNVVLESRVESLGNFSESEGDDSFVGVGNAGKREKKSNGSSSVAKFDSKKSEFIGRSSFLDDDDDCCVVLSGKDGLRQGHGVSKDKEVGNVISIDDDDGDQYSGCDLVSEEDKDSITFSGKSGTYMLPSTVAKMLYPHQRDGLRWLWSLHCQGAGGILGDDMGLGKTMQICGFLAGLFHSKLIKRALVVAPKTLLSHWIKELSAVGLAKKTREYYGASVLARDYELQYIFKDGGILLTTYDIVRNNSKSLKGAFYFKAFNDTNNEDGVAWDYVILDEGHIIKNPSTQRAKSLLEIPSFHRIIISGTPIQNNLKELWALFSFCCPQLLGDKKEFKARYESAILRGNEKNASDREKRIGSTVAKELRERIQPYFLRRLKDEVFTESKETKNTGLSKKNEIIVWLRLTRCQRQLYEAFLNSELVLSSFDGSPLAAITVLKKICDHPFLLTKRAAEDILEGMETILNQDEIGAVERMALHLANEADSEVSQQMQDVSCKISFIISLLDNLIPEGHNVLIFSQTRKMLNLVQEAITLKGYTFLRLDGTTKASERQRIVNDFQDGIGAPIFLLTSQVGGLGLTLTKADRVIVVDPAWNPSTDNQSVDRAYRIGQKKDVLVYRLMTCGTIEEKIYRMQVFKGGLFRTATEQKEQTRYFSQQDLRELFSLPKQGFDVSVTQQQMHEEHDWQHVMDDSLKKHIEFLKNQGIGGVSHHSLLFSKTTPVQVVHESNELPRKKETMFLGCSSLGSSIEHNVDGAKYAYNPKDGKQWKKNDATVSPDKPTVSEIINKIHRLQQTLANKAMVSKLPDKGERIQRQIIQLHLELERIKLANRENKETIDLDDISGKLQSVLSL